MVLKRTGFFKEMKYGEEKDPSIFASINKPVDDKALICSYLRNGYVMAACSDVVNDVVSPGNGAIGSPDDLTDGFWLWPGDLVYYVEKYDLKLDDDFVDYMKSHSWSVPQDISIDFDNLEVK